MTQTQNVQPALLTYSYALSEVYRQKYDLNPSCLAGHSLGEYTALLISGAISFEDALRIVRKRGEFMQEAAIEDGAMAAVIGADNDKLAELCQECSSDNDYVTISNFNSATQTVISGSRQAIDKVAQYYAETAVTVKFLQVSAPFHCGYMQVAADRLKDELAKYSFQNLTIPVITNVTGKPYKTKDEIINNLVKQIVMPVRWVDTINYLKTLSINTYVELGPKRALANIVKKDIPHVGSFSLDLEKDRAALLDYLSWKYGDPTVVSRCMAVIVCTKNNNDDQDEYENGVILPYKKIEAVQSDLDESKEYPTEAQMKDALEILKSVFKTKRTPMEEQVERFNQIFSETRTNDLFKDFVIE